MNDVKKFLFLTNFPT